MVIIVSHSVSDLACSSPVLDGQNQTSFNNQNSKYGQWQEIDGDHSSVSTLKWKGS